MLGKKRFAKFGGPSSIINMWKVRASGIPEQDIFLAGNMPFLEFCKKWAISNFDYQ